MPTTRDMPGMCHRFMWPNAICMYSNMIQIFGILSVMARERVITQQCYIPVGIPYLDKDAEFEFGHLANL